MTKIKDSFQATQSRRAIAKAEAQFVVDQLAEDDPLFETEMVDVGTQTLDEDPFAGNRKHENANKPKGKKKS